MRYTLILLSLLVLLCCKKKESPAPAEEPPPATTTGGTTTSGTTTGGSTTGNPPAGPPYTAELIVTNTDHSFNASYASARFYGASTSTDAIMIDQVKIDGKNMGLIPGNEYRYSNSTLTFTTAPLWEISSSLSHIPDTSLHSPAFPTVGFTKNTNLTYDKTQDFNIAIDVSGCDSMFVTLGGVRKKIAGKSGATSAIFKPTDDVKPDLFDSTRVTVDVASFNYSIFTVRGKKWKLMSVGTMLSSYKYK